MSNIGNKEIMGKNIQYYLNKTGKSKSQVCADLKFPMSSFSDWIHGKSYPRIDKIELLANYFGITKADLVEEKTEVSSSGTRSAVLLKKFNSLSEDNKVIVENMIDLMIANSLNK